MRFAVTVLLWLSPASGWCPHTTLALAIAVPTAWAQKNIIDADGYAALAQKAASDPTLQAAVASELSTRAMALIHQRGYAVGPSFPPQFADANRLAHSWMFTGADAQPDGDQWVVDLTKMLNDSAFAPMLAKFDVRVPAKVTVPVTVSTPKVLQPGKLRPLATWGPWVSIGAAVLTGLCALLTLAAARSRGRALTALGVSALLVGGAGWAAIEVARRRINHALNHTTGDIRRIAEVMVGDAESSLHQWLNLTLAAGGALVVFGVFVAALGSLRAKD